MIDPCDTDYLSAANLAYTMMGHTQRVVMLKG